MQDPFNRGFSVTDSNNTNETSLPNLKDMFTPAEQVVMYSMSREEKLQLSIDLQRYHGVFKKFWQISTIIFTNEVPTAAVFGSVDRDTVACMKINPDFWASLTPVQRLWVICHECLHAILDHFSRGRYLEHQGLANKMMDVVINHTTIEQFGFKRSEIDPDDRFCWRDKFFKPEDNVLPGQSFEYYYNEILKHPDRHNNADLMDSHHTMTEDEFHDLLKKMNGELSNLDKEGIREWLKSQLGEPGTGDGRDDGSAGAIWTFGPVKNVKKKKKFETVVKNWVLRAIGRIEKPKEQWVFEDRRMALMPKNISLPTVRDEDDIKKKKDKIDVFFFQDTSGSCWGYSERFFRVARSIPADKFNVYLFNFDTTVYDMDIEKEEAKGGGGTSFDIIERRIQEVMKEKGIAYPKAVWLITDGMGNAVHPEVPENWHWFMTEYYDKTYVHEKSTIHKLEDFE